MAWQPQADVPGGFTDEAMLVAALRGGQHEAFEALHESFAAPIYNLALRIVDDREEARDVAQEVLIKAYRGLPSEAPDLSLTPWLYRVTVNAAFDHVRARRRQPRVAGGDEQPQLAAPVDGFEQSELARRVEQTLRALPKRQQVALLLRDVHGLSVGETADALGLTRGSADVLLSRARSGFRRVFTAGADAASGHCTVAADAVAAGVGGGGDSRSREAVLAHARSCPACRKTVDLWAAAPLGLGVILPQLAAPAALSTAGTIAAAAAATATAAGGGAAGAATGGLLAKLGALAGAKVATVAVVAAIAVGTAGVATYEVKRDAGHASGRAVMSQAASRSGAAGTATAGRAGARDDWALCRERTHTRVAARARQAMRSPDRHMLRVQAAIGGSTGSMPGGVHGPGSASASAGAPGTGATAGSGAGAGVSGHGGGAGMSGPGGGAGMSGPGGGAGG